MPIDKKKNSANSLPGSKWGGVGLFFHYIKTSFRNLLKHKILNIISIIGLAIGFTCFAFAMRWIRYEINFDSFHKNAKQMYVVYSPPKNSPIPLAAYLKETFPEIAKAASVIADPGYFGKEVTIQEVEFPALTIACDSCFFQMFDIKILEGNSDFLITGNNKIAVTKEKARQIFGNENPIGKTVITKWAGSFTVCAVISGMLKPGNYPYDFIRPYSEFEMSPKAANANTIIEIFSGTDIDAFKKKLYEHKPASMDLRNNISIENLTKIHYTDPDIDREVEFHYVFIFALSGLLVILCSFLNYLILFVCHMRIRLSELALRIVCGASSYSLLLMLSVEFLIVMLLATVSGCTLTQLFNRHFLTLSHIQADLFAIYRESLAYMGCIILIMLPVFWLILLIVRQRSLNLSIRRSNKKLFRKISIVVQLAICMSFAFCTIVMLKQMYFLHNSGELGFSIKNRGAVFVSRKNGEVLANRLRQIPEITEVVETEGRMQYLLRQNMRGYFGIKTWEDQPSDAKDIRIEGITVSPEYVAHNDFKLLAGDMLAYGDPESSVLINETAAQAFGWHNPIGKQFVHSGNNYSVKGVIKNIYNFSPSEQNEPAYYSMEKNLFGSNVSTYVLFQYREGLWKICKEKIKHLIRDEYAVFSLTAIYHSEEEYDKHLKSENALIKLLSFFSVTCILICMSGFISMVSLTCEERRKEIAIRKINGATAGDILDIFAKEYFLLLGIGTAMAFSAGYLIMQRWLEHYVKQTIIPSWIYFSIIFVMALVIIGCVGWRVYKASVENPAEVVKTA